jgi:hypothetical protein
MTTPDQSLLPILQSHYNPREQGWLWVAFYDDHQPGGVVEQIDGSITAEAGAAEAAKSLAIVINGATCRRCYLLLCRETGRPAEDDREMWRALRALVDADKLVDLVVFDDRNTWSMRGEDQGAKTFAV